MEDAKQLKQIAVAFLHPERAVEVDGTATARCYFDRFSAPQQESLEESEYRHMVLEDAAALKQAAVDYAHPEIGVTTSDPTACARCYFDRPSAVEQESVEESEERAMILEDVKKLREAARHYLHPELGVVTSDPTATARCYFDRFSAVEQESVEEAEDRHMALVDAAALKQLAIDYMHPELGVVTSDPTACARCYFDRFSAVEQESVEEAEERHMALVDAAALKQLAVDYMHPELGVVTSDPTACARCYFDRFSAVEQEFVKETEEEQLLALADAALLKWLTMDHSEVGIAATQLALVASACGRCYFDRFSAVEQESAEENEEQLLALADAALLKWLTMDYMNSEVEIAAPQLALVASACARCYFDQETPEEAEERRMVLVDAAALKQLAVDYMHPELGVVTSDLTACARCYFDRFSAPREVESSKPVPTQKTSETPIKKIVSMPFVKDIGVKTVDIQMEDRIGRSASAVQLYGLDDEHFDASY